MGRDKGGRLASSDEQINAAATSAINMGLSLYRNGGGSGVDVVQRNDKEGAIYVRVCPELL